jgi:DNA-binding LacI/PurR family transcriptional regulator
LINRIKDKQLKPQNVLFKGELVVRESTGKVQ